MSIEYLQKYLSKERSGKKEDKKRKRTTQIIEDDLTGWSHQDLAHDTHEDGPSIVESDRPVAKNENKFKPAYQVDSSLTKSSGNAVPAMRAGLQTKEQVAADQAERRAMQMESAKAAQSGESDSHRQTVYRDATGRRIDIALARQEKAREQRRQEEREKKEKELGQGLVQQQMKEAKKVELEKVRSEGFSRYANHLDTEEALKRDSRWNDPAAGFLTKSNDGNVASMPVYKGAFAPNRFGIRPGYVSD